MDQAEQWKKEFDTIEALLVWIYSHSLYNWIMSPPSLISWLLTMDIFWKREYDGLIIKDINSINSCWRTNSEKNCFYKTDFLHCYLIDHQGGNCKTKLPIHFLTFRTVVGWGQQFFLFLKNKYWLTSFWEKSKEPIEKEEEDRKIISGACAPLGQILLLIALSHLAGNWYKVTENNQINNLRAHPGWGRQPKFSYLVWR